MTDTVRGDVIKGTLDMLVLQALQWGAMHGWGITELLEQRSERLLQIGQGSLYPALYRLERQGLVTSVWDVTENNRRARYYALTAAGRERLREAREEWQRASRAVSLVMQLRDA
jgi:transcriptional regulator